MIGASLGGYCTGSPAKLEPKTSWQKHSMPERNMVISFGYEYHTYQRRMLSSALDVSKAVGDTSREVDA